MDKHAILALEDGSVFNGFSFGAEESAIGEVIFNTSISGYQEILTDPSYAKQIIALTYPQIGNVGVNINDIESDAIHASGLVIKSLPKRISNWRAESSLSDFLKEKHIAGIYGIDTRRLTRLLRSKGAQNGCILRGDNAKQAIENARSFAGLKGMDLAKVVSTKESYTWNQGSYNVKTQTTLAPSRELGPISVLAYDYGIKHNILRMLQDRGCAVTVVPATVPFDSINEHYDGVFLSNGPGDPEPCNYAVESIQVMLKRNIPVFGICLGHQLLGLAAGAKTVKMKFGHHGANHPVRDLTTGEIMITSQNHGFTVDDKDLPADLKVTHRSLFDGTIQGLKHTRCQAFSFQGHPEASPGPHDCRQLFDHFISMMRSNQKQVHA